MGAHVSYNFLRIDSPVLFNSQHGTQGNEGNYRKIACACSFFRRLILNDTQLLHAGGEIDFDIVGTGQSWWCRPKKRRL